MKIRASRINNCHYCIDNHTEAARNAGETDDRIAATADWQASGLFDERERAALALTGIEAVDRCMAGIRAAVAARDGLLMVTADHGNSESMIELDGSPNTAHTINPVPLWIDRPGLPLVPGRLGDVSPTACALMGWDVPNAMTGDVLLDRRG